LTCRRSVSPRSKAAILRLLPSDGLDEIDGSELNAVRRVALELCERTIDDLTDLELFGRLTDDGWYLDLCVDSLHRLPSEVDPILGCREYTLLQARSIVKQAQDQMSRRFMNVTPGMPNE
jgi:hypothetical protein